MERPTPTSDRWERSAGWLAGAILLALGAGGCVPNRVSVAAERLPDMLRPEAGESVVLEEDGEEIVVLPDDDRDRIHFGVSLVVLGPSRLGGPQFQVIPAQWLALEAGLIGVADTAFFLWSGLRVRPVEWGSMRPFIGAFANYGGTGAVELGYGPRLGLDIDLTPWFMLTLEADGLRVEDAGGNIRSAQAGKWSATGGFAISTIF